MQCHELRYSDITLLSSKSDSKSIKTEKEAIHSGHFMVSHFEAEAQDDEYEVAVPVPETRCSDSNIPTTSELQVFSVNKPHRAMPPGQLAIETSLTKLFQCMSLAYRQKLTSPKWNRFKGIRLRWKDKIRLNNVIWRCWHMQFIKKENTLICQFASPLDEGTHNKPEAVVLEGKYWKRKLAAVTAEYKKWRMFYRNKRMGWSSKDSAVSETDICEWQNQKNDITQIGSMMVDEDYMELMSDTLFSTITSNQPFTFPDTREIARGANLADFIQPSLVQLQPNLEDFMDTFEPLQEFFSSKLPPVPEDCAVSDITYRPGQTFSELDIESETPVVQQPEQTEPENYAVTTEASPYQSVMSYNESMASVSVPPTDSSIPSHNTIKTARFYHSKARSPQMVYSARMVATVDPNQVFIASKTVPDRPDIESTVVDESFSFENDNSQASDSRTIVPSAQATVHRQSYKLPATSPKIQPSYKFQQYHKVPCTLAGSHYNRIQQNYDMTASSDTTTISDATSNKDMVKTKSTTLPSQNLSTLKSRPRTRSGSCLTTKTRSQPPPLSSANSDSALNIPSALLAQLLANNAGMYNIQSSTDRFYSAPSIIKSTNVPILPMPLKTTQQNKILPKPGPNTLLVNSPIAPSQGFINTIRPISSPELPKDTCTEKAASPATPTQSPSPIMYPSSLSPSKVNKPDVGGKLSEHRRVCHINAEQKRRYNIKNGFDVLHSLIPHLHQNPNMKLSKAAMLQKGAEYIRQLKAERLQAKEDMESLRHQIESLNTSISNCQSLLPATGAPVSRHRTIKMKEMFDEFVRIRTMENWKFWIFSILFEPLLQSFSCSVSTASYDDLYRSTLIWVEQHCSLVDLRPAVLNSLRNLCTSTDILSDPSRLPEEARAAVSKKGI